MNSEFSVKKNKKSIVKILAIVSGVVVAAIILYMIISYKKSLHYYELECQSNEGHITIIYNKSKITGYSASKISYNLVQQQNEAQKMGIDNYISQFIKQVYAFLNWNIILIEIET